ncbi:hypothetical protein [Caulobacter sp. BP25]|uniref:hypothetical protein n=1 Tax=Caulobacter sp. BP25 TaxID=2048900 RepID=UPI000C1314F0|nr:hypothetical protein [Caulobacter sp. BP25]PHY20815.1 hypothetical protein CSW59_06215 [Caulobacter sp. BP25]
MSEVDPRAVPGTFEREADGEAFVRTDEATKPADASHGAPELELAELEAIAKASEAAGFPPPPQVVAAIEAAKARSSEAAADARRQARAAASAPKPTSSASEPKPAAAPVEPKE